MVFGRDTRFFFLTLKFSMMQMLALGAIRDIMFTSLCFSSLPSIFSRSLDPILLLLTNMAMLTVECVSGSGIPSILTTFRAMPGSMWSMTVPFLMGCSFISFIPCLL